MRYRGILFLMVVTVLLFTSSITAYAKDETFDANAYIKVQSYLNLREAPDTSSKSITKLKPGQLVEVKSSDDGWSYIKLEDGKCGYAKADYIITVEKDIISAAVITSKSSTNRDFNLAKAASCIDGLVLEPGDEFNWYGTDGTDGVVGCASKEAGYKKASIISGGKYVQGYGGGVCQVSTAVYNAIYKLDIKPTEHHHHSIASSYVEKGMDATVSFPSKNFVFTNTKDYTLEFEAYTEKGQVVMLIYKK